MLLCQGTISKFQHAYRDKNAIRGYNTMSSYAKV